MRLSYQTYLLLVLCLSLAGFAFVFAQEKRPLILDDLFALEEIGEVVISPDGQTVAYVKRRALAHQQPQPFLHLFGDDRADIWIVKIDGGTPLNLTHGESDGGGFWAPTWSPDGKRLAMLSTRGDDNSRLWVWEAATGRLTKLNDRGVADSSGGWIFSWVDNQRLVAALLPVGRQPLVMSLKREVPNIATREWSKAWAGRETTVSVLESGVPANLDARPQQQMTVLDIKGNSHVLASSIEFSDLRVAPDGGSVAFLKQVALLHPNPAKLNKWYERLGEAGKRYALTIYDTRGHLIATTGGDSRVFVEPGSFRWNRDSRNFAFIGVYESDGEGPFRLFRGAGSDFRETGKLSSLNPKLIAWAGEDALLVFAEHQALISGGVAKQRSDWYLIDRDEPPRNITEQLKVAPDNLVADLTGTFFVGLVVHDLYRINIHTRNWENLTERFNEKPEHLIWPTDKPTWDTGFSEVIVSAPHGYIRLHLTSGKVTKIAHVDQQSALVAYSPKSEAVVFSSTDRLGTFLTITSGQSRISLKTNLFLRYISDSELRRIDYWGTDGQKLIGWLILPANYEIGKRYPTVTHVYAGAMYSERPPSAASLTFPSYQNLQLLSARGYAVLLPSMPLKVSVDNNGEPEDPYMELTKGVLPAIDKAIELGYVDPARLGLMGHSYGGYSTYGLVSQTNRFRAAISAAGFADLVSEYGMFEAHSRYQDFSAAEENFHPYWADTGQGRMGNPPWKDLSRYLRNSPISYVERVQTPLLIIYGDLDSVPVQQGEEFFTALYRQGKRARFLRYWGEEHSISSPPNIRDFWNQVYSWFDEFLDVSRNEKGDLIFAGDHVKSRNGAPPLKPEDFARLNQIELKSHPWVGKL